MTDEWIPVVTAVDLLTAANVPEPGKALRVALRLGNVAGRGVPATDDRRADDGGEPMRIEAAEWATWRFNAGRQSLDPPNQSHRRIASGYEDVRVSESDVLVLAEQPAQTDASAGQENFAKAQAKDDLPSAVAAALKSKFPNGRPNLIQPQLIEIAEKAVGRTVSLSTLKRALPIAWPK